LKKHNEQQAKLKAQHEGCKEFLDFMVKRIDITQLIQAIDTPVDKNPLVVLQMI